MLQGGFLRRLITIRKESREQNQQLLQSGWPEADTAKKKSKNTSSKSLAMTLAGPAMRSDRYTLSWGVLSADDSGSNHGIYGGRGFRGYNQNCSAARGRLRYSDMHSRLNSGSILRSAGHPDKQRREFLPGLYQLRRNGLIRRRFLNSPEAYNGDNRSGKEQQKRCQRHRYKRFHKTICSNNNCFRL